MTIVNERVTTTKALDDADLKALRTLVESAAFQSGIQSGFECPPPPTDTFDTITVAYADGKRASQSVTGCILNRSGRSFPQRVKEILDRY